MSEAMISRIERDARNRRARYVGDLFTVIVRRLGRFWAHRGRE